MQKMPPRLEPDQFPTTTTAIHIVTHDWMPDRRQVNANLVGSPGVQLRTQQVSRSKTGEPEKVRLRLSAVIDDCHTLSVSRISRYRFIDRQ